MELKQKTISVVIDPFSPESVRFLKTSMLSVEEKYPGETNVSSEEGIYT